MLPIYQPETAPVSIQDILAGTVLPIGAWVGTSACRRKRK